MARVPAACESRRMRAGKHGSLGDRPPAACETTGIEVPHPWYGLAEKSEPGPACPAEAHFVRRALATPSADADRAPTFLQLPAALATGDARSIRSDARRSWARHVPARRMTALPGIADGVSLRGCCRLAFPCAPYRSGLCGPVGCCVSASDEPCRLFSTGVIGCQTNERASIDASCCDEPVEKSTKSGPFARKSFPG